MPEDLPIDIVHWGAALLPIALLLVLLAVLRWQAPEAGPIGMGVGAVLALTLFRAPLETVAVGAGKGIWDALFILYVVWPALLLYRVTRGAGAFEALRQGISRFSGSGLFLVLAFGWIFASFLQGIAGFGTPIAVVAPLLVALGVRPVYAVVIPLIGHAWANMFGTLAVGWLATLQVVDLEDETATAFQTALLLVVPNLAAGFTIAWFYGRGAAVRAAWPLVLILGGVTAGGQLALTLVTPILSNFLAATAGMLLLYPLSRWSRYQEDPDTIDERPAMQDDLSEDEGDESVMGMGWATFPWVFLSVITVLGLAVNPITEALERVEVGLPFPEVSTGYDVETEGEESYSPFAPFTHPGTFLLVAALVAWIAYRSRGCYEAWARGGGEADASIGRDTADDAIPASLAIVAFLVLAQVMAHSGQTDVLALGIEAVAPAMVFAFLANFIGVVGAFMTSSNTASNVLFADLQQTVAEAQDLSEPAIIGAQSTGGAIGNAIAPANIVLGTSTAGITGEEGQVLRRTLPWVGVVALITGALTVVLVAL